MLISHEGGVLMLSAVSISIGIKRAFHIFFLFKFPSIVIVTIMQCKVESVVYSLDCFLLLFLPII